MPDILVAIALICNLAAAPTAQDCDRNNAVSVYSVPSEDGGFKTPFSCFQRGQAYVASGEMGRNIENDEYVKVVCTRRKVG